MPGGGEAGAVDLAALIQESAKKKKQQQQGEGGTVSTIAAAVLKRLKMLQNTQATIWWFDHQVPFTMDSEDEFQKLARWERAILTVLSYSTRAVILVLVSPRAPPHHHPIAPFPLPANFQFLGCPTFNVNER